MPASNWLVLLKLFLPSWSFFNDVAAVPQLEMQLVRRAGLADVWQPVFVACDNHGLPRNRPPQFVGCTARSKVWASLPRGFWNPDGNLELLENSWVERLADGLSEAQMGPGGQMESESLGMLARIVRSRLPLQTGSPGDSFRFRVVTRAAPSNMVVLLVSPEFPVIE